MNLIDFNNFIQPTKLYVNFIYILFEGGEITNHNNV